MRYVISLFTLMGLLIVMTFFVQAEDAKYDDYRISGPYTYENLSVFFFHGQDEIAHENLLTFSDALEQGKVIIHETGNVGELAIENVCDEYIFIHSGIIVKGGRQDRVIRTSVVIKPRSGRLPIEAFCVEHGRWSQRGSENAGYFESSDKFLSSKDLKLAAKAKVSQDEVWSEVSELQDKLGGVVEGDVRSSQSSSSLQLTLENKEVEKKTENFVKFMTAEMRRHDDVVGMAFAINGEINSADIYRSQSLFSKFWLKLIESCATEAIAESNDSKATDNLTPDDIAIWLVKAEQAESTQRSINDLTRLKTQEDDENIIFETLDNSDDKLIHKNVINK
jgi:ARG and Rhodanese-Phosphatase-superfamily-associated Protein domain